MTGQRKSRRPWSSRIAVLPSFRALTLVASAFVVVATTFALTQVNERQLRRTLRDEAESNLLLEARNIASLSGDALLSEFPELTLVPLVRDIQASRSELRDIVILDHAERVQGHLDPRAIGEPYTPPTDFAVLDRPILVVGETLGVTKLQILVSTPVSHHTEGRLGRVVVALDQSYIDKKIHESRKAMVIVATALGFVFIVLAMVMNALLMRPLAKLQASVRRVGRGDLDTAAEIRGPIEFKRLADTLNEMAGQLKTTRHLAEEREEEVLATQREVITTLGDVVESRSHETANHTRRVGTMSYELALLAGVPENEAELLRLAAPMHDVGKIGIPDSILNKPGKLTDDEYRVMKTHAEIGFSILSGSERPLMKAAAILAHEHHERWDGKGYPRGISGEDIHIYGRIVAVADVFDALYCDRVYRSAMPLNRVLSIIAEERGHHFDPRLVDLFLTNLDLFLDIMERLKDAPTSVTDNPVPAALPEPEPVCV